MDRGDIIRNMSNSELAIFFQKMFNSHYCPPWAKPKGKEACWKGCKLCWEQWLSTEAKRSKPEYKEGK